MTMLGELLGATIVTADLDDALAAYRQDLDYHAPRGIEIVDATQARRWNRPNAVGSRIATLIPASGVQRFLRLVESPLAAPYRPLLSAGWSAIEIVVEDLDRTAAALDGGAFRVIGPPAVLDFDFTNQIRAMQVIGSAGEVLYLTEIGAEIPGFSLPKARSPIDRPFAAILGTTDLPAAVRWYGERTGVAELPLVQARIEFLSDAHDLPRSHRHTLATAGLGGSTLMEIDAYPAITTGARANAVCGLPAGITMMSFATADPDEHGRVVTGPAGELIELLAPEDTA